MTDIVLHDLMLLVYTDEPYGIVDTRTEKLAPICNEQLPYLLFRHSVRGGRDHWKMLMEYETFEQAKAGLEKLKDALT